MRCGCGTPVSRLCRRSAHRRLLNDCLPARLLLPVARAQQVRWCSHYRTLSSSGLPRGSNGWRGAFLIEPGGRRARRCACNSVRFSGSCTRNALWFLSPERDPIIIRHNCGRSHQFWRAVGHRCTAAPSSQLEWQPMVSAGQARCNGNAGELERRLAGPTVELT